MKFSTKDFFSKCDQIRSFLRIWSHLPKKSLVEYFYFLHKNSKLVHALSMVTITNFRWSSFRCFLTSGSLSTGFACLGLIFCLSSVMFSFTISSLNISTGHGTMTGKKLCPTKAASQRTQLTDVNLKIFFELPTS